MNQSLSSMRGRESTMSFLYSVLQNQVSQSEGTVLPNRITTANTKHEDSALAPKPMCQTSSWYVRRIKKKHETTEYQIREDFPLHNSAPAPPPP